MMRLTSPRAVVHGRLPASPFIYVIRPNLSVFYLCQLPMCFCTLLLPSLVGSPLKKNGKQMYCHQNVFPIGRTSHCGKSRGR